VAAAKSPTTAKFHKNENVEHVVNKPPDLLEL
jgi:hypothetical protein